MKNNILNTEYEAKQIIAKAGEETPGVNFASAIMNAILINPLARKFSYVPILSRAFWRLATTVILAFMSLVVILVMFMPAPANKKGVSAISVVMGSVIEEFGKFCGSIQIPVLLPLVFVALFLLIFIDYLLGKKDRINYHVK